MDEEHEQVDTFLSTPDGRSIASFTSNYSDVAVITEALPYWRKKEIYKAHWDEATFLAQAQTLLSAGQHHIYRNIPDRTSSKGSLFAFPSFPAGYFICR
jgi:hypothetical protein